MQSVVTNVQHNVVCLSFVYVSMCAGMCMLVHDCELCKNGWTNRYVVWELTHVCPKNRAFDGEYDWMIRAQHRCGLSLPFLLISIYCVLLQQHISDGARHWHQDVELLSLQSDEGVPWQANIGATTHHSQSPLADLPLHLQELRKQMGNSRRFQWVGVEVDSRSKTRSRNKPEATVFLYS